MMVETTAEEAVKEATTNLRIELAGITFERDRWRTEAERFARMNRYMPWFIAGGAAVGIVVGWIVNEWIKDALRL